MVLSNFRPSGDGFKRVEYEWSNEVELGDALIGPGMTMIGWIPAFENPEILLELDPGNQVPPNEFRDDAGFLGYLNTSDYRGVIAIEKPVLHLDAKGEPGLLRFESLATAGDISEEPGRVTIKQFMRLPSGHRSLRASAALEYTFDLRDRTARMTFLGTSIPSWKRYLDRKLDSEYRIEYDLSASGYEAFLTAGETEDSPMHSHSVSAPLQVASK